MKSEKYEAKNGCKSKQYKLPLLDLLLIETSPLSICYEFVRKTLFLCVKF